MEYVRACKKDEAEHSAACRAPLLCACLQGSPPSQNSHAMLPPACARLQKNRKKPSSGRGWITTVQVEAPGVEPGSESARSRDPTCVSHALFSSVRRAHGQAHLLTSRSCGLCRLADQRCQVAQPALCALSGPRAETGRTALATRRERPRYRSRFLFATFLRGQVATSARVICPDYPRRSRIAPFHYCL